LGLGGTPGATEAGSFWVQVWARPGTLLHLASSYVQGASAFRRFLRKPRLRLDKTTMLEVLSECDVQFASARAAGSRKSFARACWRVTGTVLASADSEAWWLSLSLAASGGTPPRRCRPALDYGAAASLT
jgi:hypothetical protein